MSFRILDPAPVYLNTQGKPCSGGSLYTYDTATTTPHATYSDPALTILNANPIVLDSSGRTNTDIWATGTLRIVLKDSLGVTVFTRDDVLASSEIPSQTGQNGKYLTTNGTVMSWGAVSQIPSVTGNAGKFLTTDGTTYYWGTSAVASVDGTTISNVLMKNVREVRQTVTAAATTNIDYALGGVVVLNQAVNITALTFTNLPVAGQTAVLTIIRKKDATGTARTIAWPASFKWPGGIAPTLTQTTSGIDVFSWLTEDGGATWFNFFNSAMG